MGFWFEIRKGNDGIFSIHLNDYKLKGGYSSHAAAEEALVQKLQKLFEGK